MDLTGDLNWYDLYRHNYNIKPPNDTTDTDVWGRPLEDFLYGKTVLNGKERTYKRGHTFKEMIGGWNPGHPGVRNMRGRRPLRTEVGGAMVSDYLNAPNVQSQFGIKDFLYFNKDTTWVQCNNDINGQWHKQNEGSLWIYRIFKHVKDFKMLFFSGDTDGAVPMLGTRRWIRDLGWPVN